MGKVIWTALTLHEVIYQGYRIIYRLTPDLDAEVVTIAHGCEDLFNNLVQTFLKLDIE